MKKSMIILIWNDGKGFSDALEETNKVGMESGLSHREGLRLQLFTEEMLSMIRSVTGKMSVSFYIEYEDKRFDVHMTTKTVMDKETRENLISSSSSRKNEAAHSFLGKLRDAFERAMASGKESDYFETVKASGSVPKAEWDRYEQSVLLKLADEVKIDIRGGWVNMTVSKDFAA